MSIFKIDNTNKRIRRVIDSSLIELGKIHDRLIGKPYSKDDLVEVRDILVDMNKDLEKIDSNITDVKMDVTAEVKINTFLKDEGKTLDTLSSTFIGNQIDTLLEDLIDTKEDFYSAVTESLFLIEGLCNIYLKKTETSNTSVDFEEVEKNYE